MTYSIVARCPDTGLLGIGIATCLPAVGRIARFLEPEVGVVASQAQLLPVHGTRVLDGMRAGADPDEALTASLRLDDGSTHRQVGVVGADGRAAAHTGAECIPFAAHVTGDGFATQANMMASPGVPEAMAEAFTAGRGGHLAMRILGALDAAERLGGDIRGRQSAALHVQRPEATGDLLVDVVVDARVDDDPEPLVPLRRLVGLALGYDAASRADDLLSSGDLVASRADYLAAASLAPQDPQVPFWRAVALAGAGHTDEARAAWDDLVARSDPARWSALIDRLVAGRLVPAEVREVLPAE